MTKRMLIMLVCAGLLFGGIFGYQAFKSSRIKKAMRTQQAPPVTVSTMRAQTQTWQPRLEAVGTVRAIRGVDVTTEIAGLVRTLYFQSGDEVKEGQVLVQLNADADIALLHSLAAQAELARTTLERDKRQFALQAISQAALDVSAADLKSKQAQVAQQAAIVDKKTIRAPFVGRLGIRLINLGQYVNPGDKIVTLQSLDSIFIDFFLPQQQIPLIALEQKVSAANDAAPGRTFAGKITAINPLVDSQTRNAQVEATFANPGHALLPGMFASVEVRAGRQQRYLTLPKTAVTYNPYGETVFLVETSGRGPDGQPILTAKQTFVTAGDTRGDQVAILKGIQAGDTVVTSGQLKLKSGSRITINNQIQPSNEPAPQPAEP
jgi:membrane fusion protein (multidrug efflux system)